MEGIAAKIREVYGLPSSFMIVANYHRIGSKHGEQVHSFSFTLENPTAHKKSRARKAPSKVKRDQQRRTAHIERLNSEDGIPPAVAVVAAPVSSNRPNERQRPLLVSRGNCPVSPPAPVETKTHAPSRASRDSANMSDVGTFSPIDKHNDHALFVDPEHVVLKSGRHLVGEPALETWSASKRSIAVNALGDSDALVKAHDHSNGLATFVALEKDPDRTRRLFSRLEQELFQFSAPSPQVLVSEQKVSKKQ